MISTRHLAAAAAAALLTSCGGGGGTAGAGNGGDPALDIAVSVSAPSSAAPGATIEVRYTIRNVGSVEAGWGIELRFGHGTTPWDALERFAADNSFVTTLAPGAEYSDTAHLTLPAGLAGGTYQVAALVDGGDDGHPANDRASASIRVAGPACTDDAFEQDDLESQAKPIAIGATVTRNFCFDGVDYATFEARAGDRLGIRLVGDARVQLSITPWSGQPGAYVQTTAPGVPVSDRFTVPADGTYQILASPVATGGYGPGTEYSVALLRDLPDPEVTQLYPAGPLDVPSGGVLPVDLDVINHGYAMPGPVAVDFVLSEDGVLDAQDRRIHGETFPALGEDERRYPRYLVTIPRDVAPGSWNLFAVLNPDHAMAELVDENDVSPPLPFKVVALSCVPDAYEEDDVAADAKPIELGVAQARNHCEDGHDWVRFEAVAGEAYVLEATAAEWGDFTLDVVAPSGAAEGTETGTYGALLTFTAAETGTYRIRAGVAVPGTSRDYDLIVTRAQPDLVASATAYASGGFVAGGVMNVGVQARDLAVTPAGPFHVGLWLSRDGTLDGGDVHLVDVPLPGASWTTGAYERFTVGLPADLATGSWFLLAQADPDGAMPEIDEGNNVGEPFTLSVAAPDCTPDTFEPDDLPAFARSLPIGTPQLRNHCDDQRDWVAIAVKQGDPLALRLDQDDFSGHDLALYAEDGSTLLASHWGALFWRADRTGTVLVCAGCSDAPGLPPASYRLTADLCPPDANEPDDRSASARTIQAPVEVSLNGCDGTEDWLVFEAVATSRYGLSVSSPNAATRPTARFVDAAGMSLQLTPGGDLAGYAGLVYVQVRPPITPTLLDSAYSVSVSAR